MVCKTREALQQNLQENMQGAGNFAMGIRAEQKRGTSALDQFAGRRPSATMLTILTNQQEAVVDCCVTAKRKLEQHLQACPDCQSTS